MEEELTARQLKGFNSGYELAKHEPELFDKLLASLHRNSESEYIQGLQFGKHQADRERLLQHLKDHVKGKNQSREL